jgi:DNA-binding NarL/FixJ family response regulator
MVGMTEQRAPRGSVLFVGAARIRSLVEWLAAEGFCVRHHPASPHPVFSIVDDHPDVVVLLGSSSELIEVCAELSILVPNVPVIVCEDAGSTGRLMDAVRAGAVGYLELGTDAEEVAAACHAAAAGDTAFSPRLTTQLVDAARGLSE